MSKIRIIIDGSTGMPPELVEKYKIEIIPLNIAFGAESFVGGVDIDSETFFAKMKASPELPKTSCPSPEKFIEAYKQEGDIIMFTLTSNLSATYSTACMAKAMFEEENKDKRIVIIDSAQGSIGTGLMAAKAAQMIEAGKTIEEVVEVAEIWKKEIIHYGTLETLENAIKGGRINRVAGSIINALNFKAIIHIYNSEVKPVDKARGTNNSLKKVVELVEKALEGREDKMLWVAHANCLDKVDIIKAMLDEKVKYTDYAVAEIGPVVGTYTAEGGILVAML